MSELRHIMLVEDDSDIATLATMALQDIGGLSVTHFFTGMDALEAVDALNPDLAILDFSMPGMNGDELIQALHARPGTAEFSIVAPKTPMIILIDTEKNVQMKVRMMTSAKVELKILP